jgi:general secretion pathway protein D
LISQYQQKRVNKEGVILVICLIFSFLLYSFAYCAQPEPNVLLDKKPKTKKSKVKHPHRTKKDKKDDSKQEANIYLNFENATLESVVNYLAEEKKMNIIPHKDLATPTVSLTTRNPMKLDQAWDVLLTLLEMNGFTIVNVDDVYRIVSNKESGMEPLPTYSSKTGTKPDDLPDSDLVVRYIYFFENMKAEIAQEIMSKMMEGEGAVRINQDLQVAIIKEKCFNIKATMKIIKELDTGGLRQSIKIIPLKETSAETVETLFKEILGEESEKSLRFISTENKKEGTFFSSSTKIFSEPRRNALILLGREKNLKKIADFIYKYIDVPIGTAESRIHIKEVRYAKAESIKPILDAILKPPSGQGTETSSVVGKYKFFEDVIIVAEQGGSEGGRGSGNRLIISCNQDDWKRLDKFIDEIDKPQPQIALEVMIIDISEDQNKQLGAQVQSKDGKDLGMGINRLQFKNLHSGEGVSKKESNSENDKEKPKEETLPLKFIELASQDNLGVGAPSFLTLGRSALSNKSNIWAIVRAVLKGQNSHVIAQPFLVANNHQECSIEVSDTVKVAGGLKSEKGETSKATKVSATAGTMIRITPQINSEGIVDIKINATLSEFRKTANPVAPDTIKREIETKTTLAAGEVLILGGMRKSDQAITRHKTPVLGDIPILGNLFKSKSKKKTESNIYIFIRPSIIKPKFEGSPDEYTQLKLDYSKYQMLKNDMYMDDSDPIQRWYFKPTHSSVQNKIADAKRGIFRPVDDYTYGKRQPKSVDIKKDPYFRVQESLKTAQSILKTRLKKES